MPYGKGDYEALNACLPRVYSIAGVESKHVEKYSIENELGMKTTSPVETYLSEDCTTLMFFSETRDGDGNSSNLIDFGHGYLVGIVGYNTCLLRRRIFVSFQQGFPSNSYGNS